MSFIFLVMLLQMELKEGYWKVMHMLFFIIIIIDVTALDNRVDNTLRNFKLLWVNLFLTIKKFSICIRSTKLSLEMIWEEIVCY